MAQPMCIEFHGSRYHVTAHGNEPKPMVHTAGDLRHFLELFSDLGETLSCGK